MIDPVFATIIIIFFILSFGIGVPILNIKIPQYISYRWYVVVVILSILLGAVIDFEVLSDEIRQIILIGGLAIVGGYVLLRTFEKILANGWLHGSSIEAKKGDITVKLTSQKDEESDGK